jgi:hypothetical protein
MVSLLLVLMVFVGVVCVVVGLSVRGARALAVFGGALLILVATFVAWLMLIFMGVVNVEGWLAAVGIRLERPWVAVAYLTPPFLPAIIFLSLYAALAGRR